MSTETNTETTETGNGTSLFNADVIFDVSIGRAFHIHSELEDEEKEQLEEMFKAFSKDIERFIDNRTKELDETTKAFFEMNAVEYHEMPSLGSIIRSILG